MTADPLLTLLQDQKDALLRGDYNALSGVLHALDRAVATPARLPRDPSVLADAQRQAARNSQLLAAATDGVRQVRAQIRSDLGEPDLTTYTKSGEKQVVHTRAARDLRREPGQNR